MAQSWVAPALRVDVRVRRPRIQARYGDKRSTTGDLQSRRHIVLSFEWPSRQPKSDTYKAGAASFAERHHQANVFGSGRLNVTTL
jgi:hypothetical protein